MFDRLLARYQLIALQEPNFSKEDRLQSTNYFVHKADSAAKCFWTHTTSNIYNGRHGAGLIVGSSCPFQDFEDITPTVCSDPLRNRYLLLKAAIPDHGNVLIHVVYAPDEPALRAEFFDALPTTFPPDASHIAMGDFNVTLDTNLDQVTNSHHGGVGRPALQNWLSTIGLIDAWRFTNPEEREYTSPTRRNRLDFCFLSLNLLQDALRSISHVYDTKYHKEDHAPVQVELSSYRIPQFKRSPWRCPPWILQVPEVHDYLATTVVQLADRLRLFEGDNPGCLLDEHKRADSIYLRKQVKDRHHADRKKMQALLQAVQDAQDLLNISPSELHRDLLVKCRIEVKAFQDQLQHRNQYSKFVHDLEHGERTSAAFFRPPKPAQLQVPITEVLLETGERTRDPTLGAEAHRNYWGKLFQSTSEDLAVARTDTYQPLQLSRFLQATVAKLTNVQRQAMDAPLTANDFYWSIVTSKKNKAPGPDGLPVEYYLTDPHLWAKIYEVIYAAQLRQGMMTKFQRRAHLALLYKAGDRAVPSNYRPLTLLNHDAKFGPKIHAYRLRSVLPVLIHEDQAGFVNGRSIRHSLRRFQDLQNLSRLDHKSAGAVLLDFAKAFDSVVWPALFLVLRHFGFGDTFLSWIKTFYKDTSVSILLNNSPSAPFKLGAGVRQGDPLSPALFVLFIEPMMNYLREKCGSLGVTFESSSSPHLLLSFADDCTGILRDISRAPSFLHHVQVYAAAAGLSLNLTKTCIMPFSKDVPREILETLRTTMEVRVLGVLETTKLLGILQGACITDKQRFEPLLDQMRTRCVLWKYRARTLAGRISILRSIVLPLLWYTATCVSTPQWVFDAAEVIIRNFINQKAPSATASPGLLGKEWIFTRVKDGGLGLTHPKIFIQASYLVSLRDAMHHVVRTSGPARWFEPALDLFSRALSGQGVGFDVLYAKIPGTFASTSPWCLLPDFWYKTLQLWHSLHAKFGTTDWKQHAQEMPLWNNIHLLFGSTKRPLHALSKSSSVLMLLARARLQDFVEKDGQFPNVELLRDILPSEAFVRAASKTRFVKDFVARLNVVIPEQGVREGPRLSNVLTSATHSWALDTLQVVNMSNHDFVRLFQEGSSAPTPDWKRLQVSTSTPRIDWLGEYRLNQQVLPICSDVKFRVQHNALGFRYKYQWRTTVISSKTCAHGCAELEDAKHLFWDCPVARHQWEAFTPWFEALLDGDFTWTAALYPTTAKFTQMALKQYGRLASLQTFNIFRCCIFRGLWLHRNDKLYNPEVTSSKIKVKYHVSAYVRLHLRSLSKSAESNGLLQLQRLLHHAASTFEQRTQ